MNVLFDNIVNARDLGGMTGAGGRQVRAHRLLRTAHLHDATHSDIRRLQQEYHLATIFDFRSLGEAEALPDLAVPGATHHLLPTIDLSAERLTEQPIPQESFLNLEAHIVNYSFYPEVQQMAANMYLSLIRSEYSQLQYATFLRLIVEAPEDGGVLWHCFQGKDRTGWGAAFLLSALGVEREAIIADFDLSNEAYRELVAKLNAQIDEQGGGEAEKEVVLAFMGVSTPNFIRTLDLIDNEFGGMNAYLREQLLLTTDDMHKLRKRFLV
ncbi:MAG: tyrosine-protein phosphatase [Paludibacteraceae bacterium]|nr:tyrosine-protein phosphatase [Paludibacteraceae bacterium]